MQHCFLNTFLFSCGLPGWDGYCYLCSQHLLDCDCLTGLSSEVTISKGNLSFKHRLHMQESFILWILCSSIIYVSLQQACNQFLIFTLNWKEQFVLKCTCLKTSCLKKKNQQPKKCTSQEPTYTKKKKKSWTKCSQLESHNKTRLDTKSPWHHELTNTHQSYKKSTSHSRVCGKRKAPIDENN